MGRVRGKVLQTRAEQLLDYLSGIRARPQRMRPGSFDCALFAAGWVKHCTGQDLAADWRGTYRSYDGGRDLLRGAGFADLANLAAHHLTEVEGWGVSQPGDIAAIVENGETALGIIGGPQIHVLSLDGLDYVHLGRAARVFRP